MPQYLLTRQAQLSPGQTTKSLEWAQNVTEKVGSVTGLPVRLYQQVFSPQVGGLQWHVFVPNISTLESLLDKIQQDDSAIKLIDTGAQFLTPQNMGASVGHVSDYLSTVISGDVGQHGSQAARGGPQYQAIVQAIMNPGNYAEAMQLGPKIAQQVEKTSGAPTLFAVDQTGVYGGARFITSFGDVREMEQSQQRLQENREWLQFVDEQIAGVFSDQPFSTSQAIYRRLLT